MGDNFAPGFVVGFVTGVVIAGLVGASSVKILQCWKKVTAIRKPQTIKTDKTPWQVLSDGCKNLLILIILFILILAGIFLFVATSVLG
jgi:hypothetical protein